MIKFINFLTIDGKKEKYSKFFFKAINLFFSKIHDTNPVNQNYFFTDFSYDWKTVFTQLNTFFYPYHDNTFFLAKFTLNTEEQEMFEDGLNSEQLKNFKEKQLQFRLNFNRIQENIGRKHNDLTFKNFLYQKLIPFFPIFNFFIYNVDKNIKKFTRGKSGKFVFIWKFIPVHKRENLILKLLKKNIIFNSGKKYFLKIFNLLTQIFYNPSRNFLTKSKYFITRYVYKNFKTTLMVKMKTAR